MISSDSNDILLKSFESLITIPSYFLSVIKVFEPPPRINIFSLLSIFLRNLINSLRFFAL